MSCSIRTFKLNPALRISLTEGFVIALFGAFYFSYTLTHFDYNDFLYATTAHMSGKLYRDLHYNQAPFGFYFWRLVESLSPEGESYLIFRLVSASLGFTAVVFAAQQFLSSLSMRLVFLALAASSTPLMVVGGEIGTYTLAIFLMVLGYSALFARMPAPLRYGLCALAIGLSASSKLNHILLMLPLLALMYSERDKVKLRPTSGAFTVGALVGLGPCIFYFLDAPKAFLLHNIYHSQFAMAAVEHGISGALQAMYHMLKTVAEEQAVVFVLGIYMVVVATSARDRHNIFLLSAAVIGMIMALAPIRSAPQYFGPAALLVFLFYCRVGLGVGRAQRLVYLMPALTMGMLGLANNAWILACQVANSYRGIAPSISQVADINHTLRSFRQTHELCNDQVFSLAGALVADSGFRLSRNMELGPFWQLLSGYIPGRYFDDPTYQIDRALIEPADWIVSSGIRFWVVGYFPNSVTEMKLDQTAKERNYVTEPLTRFDTRTISFVFDPTCVKDRPVFWSAA
jgi:hypothetical protein